MNLLKLRTVACCILLSVLIAPACKKNRQSTPIPPEIEVPVVIPPPPVVNPKAELYPAPCECDVALLDWGTDNIDFYDGYASDWSQPAAQTWTFKPSTSISGGNWTAAESSAPGWDNPKDVKVRLNAALGTGTEWIAAVAGETALITSNSKIKKWSTNIGAGVNPQSIEILSNGNVAVAAATGNWVKLYSTSGSMSATYTLYNAHSVLWDPIESRLWATGQLSSGGPWKIVAFSVGTAAAPALTLDDSRTFTTSSTFLRHISPVVGDPDKLWVSADQGVYIYDKSTKAFTLQNGKLFNKNQANSTANQPSGQIIQVAATSATPNTTNKINLYATSATGAGSLINTHTMTGSIYKAIPVNTNYQSRKYYGIATYNIRQSNVGQGNEAWSVRRPLVTQVIRKYDFDIWGGQEVTGNQTVHLAKDLPEYTKFGTGRDGDGTGSGTSEHSPIFYKHWRFTALTTGQFWLAPGAPLSKPPTKPWNTSFYRIVTYARFQNNYTGEIFWIFNAHFDHESPSARQNSAKLVLDEMAPKIGSEPAIFMGDLNAEQNSVAYDILQNSTMLKDVYELVPESQRYAGTKGTPNGYNPNANHTRRIDHIFTTTHWNNYSHNVLTDLFNGVLPSDHYAVLVETKLP